MASYIHVYIYTTYTYHKRNNLYHLNTKSMGFLVYKGKYCLPLLTSTYKKTFVQEVNDII